MANTHKPTRVTIDNPTTWGGGTRLNERIAQARRQGAVNYGETMHFILHHVGSHPMSPRELADMMHVYEPANIRDTLFLLGSQGLVDRVRVEAKRGHSWQLTPKGLKLNLEWNSTYGCPRDSHQRFQDYYKAKIG